MQWLITNCSIQSTQFWKEHTMEEILLTHSVILFNLFQSQLKLNENKNHTWECSNRLKANSLDQGNETITIEQHC